MQRFTTAQCGVPSCFHGGWYACEIMYSLVNRAGSGGGGGLSGAAGGAGLGAPVAGGAAHLSALPTPSPSINPAAHYASARSWGGGRPPAHCCGSLGPRRRVSVGTAPGRVPLGL